MPIGGMPSVLFADLVRNMVQEEKRNPSVAGGYEYYAIRMSDGVIVHGAEPEFEETTDAAPSFARFMEMICAGDIL